MTPGGDQRRRVPPVIPATHLDGVCILKQGRDVLVTDGAGNIAPDDRGLGLYRGDTRVLSCLRLRVAGAEPTLLQADAGGASAGTCVLSLAVAAQTGDERTATAPVRHQVTLERRRLLDDGLSEVLVLANHTDGEVELRVALDVDADFADLFEVRGVTRLRRGDLWPAQLDADSVTLAYRAVDGRGMRVRIVAPGAVATVPLDHVAVDAGPAAARPSAAALLAWAGRLPAAATTTLSWAVTVEDDASAELAPRSPAALPGPEPRIRPATGVRASDPAFERIIARSLADLDLLLTPGPEPGQRHLAAGVPWFTGLFGRDSLIASLAALPFRSDLAVDALRVLAAAQALEDDPERDAEPGKIPHELHDGDMARRGEVVFGRYYGSADATPLWCMLLAETIAWTGDRTLLEELWPHALRALAWIENAEARGVRGCIAYQRRAEHGLVHHGWKDSLDAIRFADGRIAAPPIALLEVQAYAFAARRGLAGLARLRGDDVLARQLDRDAAATRHRVKAAFWLPAAGTYAIALDGTGRPVDGLGSNAGHALWTGIAGSGHARLTARTLMSPTFRSGWGLRTLAAGQPGYNPMGYHTGSVWPHDTAIAVAGIRRAGLPDDAAALAAELFAAAGCFPGGLPELYGGFERVGERPPVPYPFACVPQAWAAAAPLLALTAVLGLRVATPAGGLHVDRPRLPPGADRLVLEGLAVGPRSVDLRFARHGRGVAVKLRAPDGRLVLARAGTRSEPGPG